MQALTATQVILWEDGRYSAITVAVNDDIVPFTMFGDSRRMTFDELLSHLTEVRGKRAGTDAFDKTKTGKQVKP